MVEKKISSATSSEDGKEVEDDAPDRAAWGGQIEFILTCVGYAVGLGNVWRFPYLCYSNGGGAFLIPYVLMLALVGLPLFFMELSLGQFASLGPLAIWKFNPIWKGLGYASVMVSFIIALYYNVIISVCAYFLFKSMAAVVPWESCTNPWNTFQCLVTKPGSADSGTSVNSTTNSNTTTVANLTTTMMATTTMPAGFSTMPPNTSFCSDLIADLNLPEDAYIGNLTCFNRTTPSEEFFYNYILRVTDGMDEPGGMNWPLAGCLCFCWFIVAIVLVKGISSLGKVVYFTALFPYVLLTILLVNGAMLPGARVGIEYYLTPKWEKLLEGKVWSDAAVQIFYSLGVGSGGLIAMASYNKFKNNCLRDSLIVPVVNCGTSIYAGFVIFSVLGYMAEIKKTTVDKVATQGPGLTFVVYPEALSTMPFPPIWSILFFFMMMTLGFSSQFSTFETVLTAVLDELPSLKATRKREIAFRLGACFFGLLLGLPMCMDGGFYLLNLVDNFVGGFPLIIVGIGELVAVNWLYGFKNFSDDIEMMLGRRPPLYFLATWIVISPLLMVACLVFTAIQYAPLEFNGYLYTDNYSTIGWFIIAGCVGFIPLWWVAQVVRLGWKQAISPKESWGPASSSDRVGTKYERERALENLGGADNHAYVNGEKPMKS